MYLLNCHLKQKQGAEKKLAADWEKELPPQSLCMLGGVFEDCIFTANDLDRLKNFPTLEEAHAELIGTINAPVTNLIGHQLLGSLTSGPKQVVTCLQTSTKGIVQLLDVRKDQLQ